MAKIVSEAVLSKAAIFHKALMLAPLKLCFAYLIDLKKYVSLYDAMLILKISLDSCLRRNDNFSVYVITSPPSR